MLSVELHKLRVSEAELNQTLEIRDALINQLENDLASLNRFLGSASCIPGSLVPSITNLHPGSPPYQGINSPSTHDIFPSSSSSDHLASAYGNETVYDRCQSPYGWSEGEKASLTGSEVCLASACNKSK
ncbi:unnamed protein product, partial [Protopolystoma xenopodis]